MKRGGARPYPYYPKWSVAYRLQTLKKALGWTWVQVAKVSGIGRNDIYQNLKWQYKYNNLVYMRPSTSTIRKLIAIETTYGAILRRYKRNPRRWDRSKEVQHKRMVPLKPIGIFPVGIPQPLAVLAPRSYPQNKDRSPKRPPEYILKKRSEVNAQRGRTLSQYAARKAAQGWNWHEVRAKAQLGRPYYNMGRERALAQGIPIESIPKRSKRRRFPKAFPIVRKVKEK